MPFRADYEQPIAVSTRGTTMPNKQPNKLKVVKRQLDCLELFPADGGFIVRKRFKWEDLGPGVKFEKEPEPAIFSSGESDKMIAYIRKEMGCN